jgi:hypothetical protein
MKIKKLFRWAGVFTVVASTLWAVSASANHFEGIVWYDSNCDGVLQAGELGVPDVVVEARNCSDGTLVGTAITQADGTFLFYEGVNDVTLPFVPKPGPYKLCFKNLPAGFSFSPQIYPPIAGETNSTVAADGCTPCFQFDFEDNSTLNNAGLCQAPPPCTGEIGDFVWADLNGNGCQDAGEPGIPGVRVDLYSGCPASGNALQTTTTDANGKYLFTGLCAGTYTVHFHTPIGLVHTLAHQNCGSVGGQPSDQRDSNCDCTGTEDCSVCVTLATASSQDLSIDCGYLLVPPTGPLTPGDTATIGFWHNKNGQALIKSFNGGPTSTLLGTWLANNYGCLFGNLHGQPNTVVAAQFMTYFNVTGEKTYAQIMAGALAAYATSSTLGGGSIAGGYGFNISPGGTGDKTYNVGSYGAAIGLVNNTSYTVAQLLAAANANCTGGLINPAAFDALNNIFDGINSSGDI